MHQLTELPNPGDLKPTQEEWEQYMTSKYGGSQALELLLNAIHDNPSAVDSPEYGYIAGHSRRELGVLVRCSSVAAHGRMSLDNTVQRCLADIKAASA